MANISGSYDPNAEAYSSFDPIPNGEYRAVIIESAFEDISKRDNKGRCLNLTWKIETGPYDGRLIWQRLNMWAENMNNLEKVINIAQSQFAAIREATGKLTPQDSDELHHIPCMIKVVIKNDPSGQYQPRNEISSVKPVVGQATQNPASMPNNTPPPAVAAQANTGSGNKPSRPWEKAPA